jgi:hypothetical protein
MMDVYFGQSYPARTLKLTLQIIKILARQSRNFQLGDLINKNDEYARLCAVRNGLGAWTGEFSKLLDDVGELIKKERKRMVTEKVVDVLCKSCLGKLADALGNKFESTNSERHSKVENIMHGLMMGASIATYKKRELPQPGNMVLGWRSGCV